MDHHHAAADPACAMAHGELPPPTAGRRLAVVFASPVARELAHFGAHLGFEVLLVDPDPAASVPGARRQAAELLDADTDVVVTDHDRPELGPVLARVLATPARWVGVMGSPRHTAPHLAALAAEGVAPAQVARVHRPIGLDIGSRSPAEIALATLAGLLADRNGRSGGFYR